MIRKLLLISFFSAISLCGIAQDQNGIYKLAEPTPPNFMAKQAFAELTNNSLVDLFYDFESGYPSNAYYTSVGYEGTGLYGRSSGDSVTVVNSPFQRVQAVDTTYLNSYSLKSAAITHGEASNIHFYVKIAPGGGSFQFRYKVSSESGWDFLHVDLNKSRLADFSGEVNWNLSPTYNLTEGEHRIDFWYTKNGSQSVGMDAAFIDNISIINADGTPARITKIEPNASATSVDITLYGTGLSTTTPTNRVYFGDTGYYWYNIAQSPNKMIFRVNENIAPGNYSLTLDNPYGTFTYPNLFSALTPNEPSFTSSSVITTQADGAYSVFAADLDNDGLQDVLSASQFDNKIAWYKNNGDDTFTAQPAISTNASAAFSVYAADLDDDGLLDVLSASFSDNKIAWYKNNGDGTFTAQPAISTTASGAFSVYAVDLDSDGLLDVLSASFLDNKIAWYKNNGDGTFTAQSAISTAAIGAYRVYAADLDNDGLPDVLSASRDDDKIAWYKNNGDGTFTTQPAISTTADGASSVYAADLDGDGLLDVLSASINDDKIAWYKNNGDGTFTAQPAISTTADGAFSVYAADLNGDGLSDVLSASQSDSKIAWYKNNGDGTFASQTAITTTAIGARSVYTADLTGNGLLDVLSASFSDDKIAWYENSGTVVEETGLAVTKVSPNAAAPGTNITLYGKGFSETASENTVKFNSVAATVQSSLPNKLTVTVPETTPGFKNVSVVVNNDTAQYAGNFSILTPNEPSISSTSVITTQANGVRSVYAADLDGDGLPDVLSASNGDNKIAWYENNGDGTFGAQSIITTAAAGAWSVYVTDLTGNGFLDVLSASISDDKIAWYKNNGDGTFGAQSVISTTADAARSVYATDLDGDGLPDVLSASSSDDKIAWYKNNGDGTFGTESIISTTAYNARSVYATDLDGDGLPDVLSASYTFDKIAWYKNNGDGTFGTESVINSTADHGANSVHAADLDGDGLPDVLSASNHDNKIAWYQNNGNGNFGAQQIISTAADGANTVYAADLNGDGLPDVLSASQVDGKIAWYRNNGDGTFGTQSVISNSADYAQSVYAADLTGNGLLDVLSASNNYNITWYKNVQTSSISEARQRPNGEFVRVRGIITRASANIKKIQQDSSALHLYATTDFNQLLYNANVQAGDSVEVTGTLGEFSGLKELINIDSVQVLSSGNPLPAPITVTLSEINDFEKFESVLISVENVSTDSTGSEFRFSTNYRISQNQALSDVNLFIGSEANIDFEGGIIPDFFNFTGVVYQNSNETPAYSLYPIGINDIEATLPDNIIYSISEAKTLPDSSLVRVRGVATTPNLESNSRTSFFIQDETTGILIYNFGTPIRNIATGDSIEVTGIVETVLGNKQVTVSDIDADINILNSGNTLPEPQLVTFDEYKSAGNYTTDTQNLQGTLVRFEQLSADPNLWPADLNATSITIGASTLQDSTLNIALYEGTEVMGYTPPASFDLIGVLHASDGPQIAPRFESDVTDAGVLSPYDLTASEVNNTIELEWRSSPSINAGAFNLYRSTNAFSDSVNATKLNSTPLSDTTFTDINISENNSYFYRVAAIDTVTGNVSRLSNSSRVSYKFISIQFASPLSGIPGKTIKSFGTNIGGSSLLFDGPVDSDSLSENSRSFVIPDVAPGNYELSLDYGGATPLVLSSPITVIDSVSGNSGYFGSSIPLNDEFTSIEKVYTQDLDGDLDLDIIVTLNNSGGGKIVWFENNGNRNFSTPNVIKNDNSSKTYSIDFGDLNNNGRIDIAAVTENTSAKLWFENNGDGSFTEKVIALPPASGVHSETGAVQVTTADINLDSFVDIVVSSPADDAIYWYRNSGSDSWSLQPSIASAVNPNNVQALDIHDDGDIDFLLTHQADNTAAFIINNGDGTFNAPGGFLGSATHVTDLTTADINSDGNMDVLLISANNSSLYFYPNNPSQTITDPSSISVNDLNGDGHTDIIVSTSAGQILWFENDGTGTFETPTEIASDLGDIGSLVTAELTGNGTIDILTGNMDNGSLQFIINSHTPPSAPTNVQIATGIGNATLTWDENTEPYLAGYKVHRSVDSLDGFTPLFEELIQQNSFTDDSLSNGISYHYYITAVDTNGNQSLNSDTLSITAVSTQISAIEPLSGSEGTLVKLTGVGFSSVQSSNTVQFDATEATILTSDSLSILVEVPAGLAGSVPVSVSSEGSSYTFPATFDIVNSNDGTFTTPIIQTGIGGDGNLIKADVNADGFMDLILPRPDRNSISIFFSDGADPYTNELEFPVSAATSVVRTANIYGNNYPDLIYITGNNNEFRILKNNGGNTNSTAFMDQVTVSINNINPSDIYPADMDNDGFQDVLIASTGDSKISWYKNESANGNIDFGTENVITNSASGVSSIYATDVNNDGRTDVLATLANANRIVWYRNEGDGTFTELVIDDGIITPSKVTAADFNNDGNTDVLFNTSGNSEVSLYLNDGTGTFDTFINLSTSMTGGGGLEAGDIDGDGVIDVLASSITNGTIHWFRNNADSSFSEAILISDEFSGASDAILHDFNGDGNLDIATRSTGQNSIGVIPNFQPTPIQVEEFIAGNNNIMKINDRVEVVFNTEINSIPNLSSALANAVSISNISGQGFELVSIGFGDNSIDFSETDFYAADTLYLSISGQNVWEETLGMAYLDSNNNGEYDENESDYISPEFYTTLIGDFNRDLTVNFDDLVLFSDGWRNSDFQYETAPLSFSGFLDFPNARLNSDNNFNIDDLVSFIRYWNYSQDRAEQAKAKELASKLSTDEIADNAKRIKAAKQNQSTDIASELDYISYEKLISHNEYVQEQRGIESTYLLSLSHPDSVQALALSVEYDPENVKVMNIEDLDLFDIHSPNSNVFISRIDSIHGVITLNVANFGELTPIEKRDLASITFRSLNDQNSDITITSDIRVRNKEAQIQMAKKVVNVTEDLPEKFTISQNYPNPFNPTTTIHYELAEQAKVSLTVYDILGRKVETLINENGVRPGYYKVNWDASRYASGMYIYVVNIRSNSGQTHTMSKKMLLVK